MCRRSIDWRAPINMREIHEGRVGARGVAGVDRTLIKIDRARVQIGCGTSVGNSEQFQVVGSLLHPAAIVPWVTAVCDAGVPDLCPRSAAVLALPNALIYDFAGGC